MTQEERCELALQTEEPERARAPWFSIWRWKAAEKRRFMLCLKASSPEYGRTMAVKNRKTPFSTSWTP